MSNSTIYQTPAPVNLRNKFNAYIVHDARVAARELIERTLQDVAIIDRNGNVLVAVMAALKPGDRIIEVKTL